jgi:hypothetical protein
VIISLYVFRFLSFPILSSAMTKDGNDSDGLGEVHPAFWASHLSASDERRIRKECHIPSFIKIRFDGKSGAVARSDIHEVCVYEHMFRAGLRLPFIPIIRELLSFLNLSPHQLSPNAWRTFLACVILWPLSMGPGHTLTIGEFLYIYRLQKNPQSSSVYNFQTRRGKFLQIDSQFSSNPKWKNKYFFLSGQWEFRPTERAEGPRVPRDINDPPSEAYEEPVRTPEMVRRINQVIKWGREHPKMMFVGSLITVTKLSEFVYDVESFRRASRPASDPLRARLDPEGRLDPSGPAANTRASTPQKRKGDSPLAAQVKPKAVDKGKAKVVDTGKPAKAVYPVMTGGDFKIREPKVPTPPSLPINPPPEEGLAKKPEETPKVARALKLLDEEESPEAGGPAKDLPGPVPKTHSATDESVEVVEAPLAKKRKLTRAAGIDPKVDEAAGVAGFLASRRLNAAPLSIPPLGEVEKFIANEPVLAVPVAVARMAEEEPLRVPEGSIPVLSQPLGSNIRHILEEIEMMSDDSVGVAGDNMGTPLKAAEGVPGRALSPIPEVGNSSRAPTPARPRSPTPDESRRLNASEASRASSSEGTVEVKPEGANWTVGGRLAKLGGEFKGNPFKAVVDLVDHDGLQLKRDITLRGVAEEMLTAQCLVSVEHAFALSSRIFSLTSRLLCSQAFLRSTVLYCYMRKVSTSDSGPSDLQRRLSEVEEENANLQRSVAKHEEDLRVLAEHSAMMECEASDASKARDRAETRLSNLSEEIERLRSENAKLREDHRVLEVENAGLLEDHSILKEDYKLLEEKQSDILEQLAESQASAERAAEGRVVAEEKFHHFNTLYKGMRLELKEAKAKAADYLHQLSFASRVRDSAWADGLHLGFETFRTWWRDPARKMDLNSVNIEDIPMTKEAIRQLISLGREEMPDAAGIDRFAYHPEAAPEGGEAEKEHDDAENPLPAEDPPT